MTKKRLRWKDCLLVVWVGAVLLCGTQVRAASCPNYAKGVEVGTLEDKKLDESSGLAASRRNPGVWWSHNDSGGKTRLYAFDRQGKRIGRYSVPGAAHKDWEDMAAGPCPDGSACLFIADVGDNFSRRSSITIYRIPEPKVDPAQPKDGTTAQAVVFTLTYPDGARDCEALLVHPKTGDIYLASKVYAAYSDIYTLPASTKPGKATLTKLHRLTFQGAAVTGGDFSPQGDQLVLRTYTHALVYKVTQGFPKAAALQQRLALARTRQGEAIAYALDAQSLFTTTEKTPAPIHQYNCTSRPEPRVEAIAETTEERVQEPAPQTPDESPQANEGRPDANKPEARPETRSAPDTSSSSPDNTKNTTPETSSTDTKSEPDSCSCQEHSPATMLWWGLLLLGGLCYRRRVQGRHAHK